MEPGREQRTWMCAPNTNHCAWKEFVCEAVLSFYTGKKKRTELRTSRGRSRTLLRSSSRQNIKSLQT
jgi:transcriptional regulator of met regulon